MGKLRLELGRLVACMIWMQFPHEGAELPRHRRDHLVLLLAPRLEAPVAVTQAVLGPPGQLLHFARG